MKEKRKPKKLIDRYEKNLENTLCVPYKYKLKKKNKKAQTDFPILMVAFMIIGLLILSPIILKIFISMRDGLGAGFGNVTNGGVEAQTAYNSVMNTAINAWDKVVVAFFVLMILLLFVSAFMIDAHPFFIILYILMAFFLILIAPNMIEAVDKIYDSSIFATETAMLVFMNSLRSHYAEYLVGLMVITGIIIYGKIALFKKRE